MVDAKAKGGKGGATKEGKSKAITQSARAGLQVGVVSGGCWRGDINGKGTRRDNTRKDTRHRRRQADGSAGGAGQLFAQS